MTPRAAAARAALGFLTVLPAGPLPGEPGVARRALAWFPVVGLLVGLGLCGVLLLPIPDLPRAALAAALWVAVTGGLHEDAWSDCADAAFAPVGPERRLEILRDPRVGAHGLSAGVLLHLLRFAALAVVAPAAALAPPVVGRWAMALSAARARPARATGLGASHAGASALAPTLVAAAALAACAWWAGPFATAAAWLAGAAVAWGSARFLGKRFGGLTGDGHGAVGVAAELAALWSSVAAPGLGGS